LLWDVREEALNELAESLRTEYPHLQIFTQVVNLLFLDQISLAAQNAISKSTIDCVVNSAGVAFCSDQARKITDAQEEAMMRINYLAPVSIIKFFVEYFDKNGGGHIVTVLSMASFLSSAGMPSYCATKYALRGFIEGLSSELSIRRSKVTLSAFCPAAFKSKLFDGFDESIFKPLACERVANDLVHYSIKRRQVVTLVPGYFGIAAALSTLFNALGFFLVIPINPVVNWKGAEHSQQSLGE
jgi:short-subunit dehydrogenase